MGGQGSKNANKNADTCGFLFIEQYVTTIVAG